MDFSPRKHQLNVCGPQISRLRSQKAWSQETLAMKCQLAGWDVSRDIIARIELRIRRVDEWQLAFIACVLEAPIEELFPAKIRARLP